MGKDEIILRCKRNERQAQSELFRIHYPILYGIISRYFLDNDTRKEVLQEAFIKIFSRLKQLKDNKSFDSWSKRITINLCLDKIKASQKIVFEDTEDWQDEELYDMSNYEEETMSLEDIITTIKKLPHGYRTIFNLYAIDELTHKEISDQLGISVSTSKTQYFKAKKMIRKMIKHYKNVE